MLWSLEWRSGNQNVCSALLESWMYPIYLYTYLRSILRYQAVFVKWNLLFAKLKTCSFIFSHSYKRLLTRKETLIALSKVNYNNLFEKYFYVESYWDLVKEMIGTGYLTSPNKVTRPRESGKFEEERHHSDFGSIGGRRFCYEKD